MPCMPFSHHVWSGVIVPSDFFVSIVRLPLMRVIFCLKCTWSLPCACALIALYVRVMIICEPTHKLCNIRSQGSDQKCWSQKVTLSWKQSDYTPMHALPFSTLTSQRHLCNFHCLHQNYPEVQKLPFHTILSKWWLLL